MRLTIEDATKGQARTGLSLQIAGKAHKRRHSQEIRRRREDFCFTASGQADIKEILLLSLALSRLSALGRGRPGAELDKDDMR